MIDFAEYKANVGEFYSLACGTCFAKWIADIRVEAMLTKNTTTARIAVGLPVQCTCMYACVSACISVCMYIRQMYVCM